MPPLAKHASLSSVASRSHHWFLPLNMDTPRMEKMSQKMHMSRNTLQMPGMAFTSADTTT